MLVTQRAFQQTVSPQMQLDFLGKVFLGKWAREQLLLPPITKDSAKLDLGATEGRYDGNLDGNLSTCDYPRVNWTRSLDCDGQNGTVSSS